MHLQPLNTSVHFTQCEFYEVHRGSKLKKQDFVNLLDEESNMNGGLTYATTPSNNNTSELDTVPNGLRLKTSHSPDPPVENGLSNGNGPLHIPAKRVGGHWTSPHSVASTSASNYSIDNNSDTPSSTATAGVDPLMAVSAVSTSPYATSHYSSLAASEAARRGGGTTPTGNGSMTADTKPGLSFWQNDYHKYSVAAAASASTAAVANAASQGASTPGTPSVTMAAVAASECSQMSAAAGFAAHQAAAWNYPHPGQYAAALASPEQAAAEAARARQMAAESAGFHTADYTRLQYPPDGIYAHPPGMSIPYLCKGGVNSRG